MSQSLSYRPASSLSLANYYFQDLARSIARMAIRRMRRTSDQVDTEYNSGHWLQVRSQRPWAQAANLKSFLVGADKTPIVAKLKGRVVKIPKDEYYGLRLEGLQRILAAHAGESDELVELGAGFGYNLFSLALANHWKRFTGLDISENGIAAAREIAAHFSLTEKMEFGPIDLTDSKHPNFSKIRDKTVFTYFCIEQVPHHVEGVIRNIIANRPKRVIQVEPTTELLKMWKAMDLLNFFYVKSMDYQTRLFTVLEAMAARGEVRILSRERLDFAPTIHNDGFLIAWEPV